MKKLMIACAAMLCITACETKVASDTSTNTAAVADANAEKTKMVYRALETGDVKGLDSLFSNDVVDHEGNPYTGKDLVGKDSVIAMIGQMHNFFTNMKVEMLSHATSNDGVYHFASMRLTGKSTDKCPWLPPNTEADDMLVDVIKLKDGKCTDHWQYLSMKDMGEAMASMQGGMPMEKKK